ncbi:putative DNA-binding domain-containing protein [Arenicellales bacterium nBUS_45]
MWQSEFSAALKNVETRDSVVSPSLNAALKSGRFQVYQNNVYSSLVKTLRHGYPVVAKLVGDEFFSYLASSYVREHLPRSPVLMFYGREFGSFIDQFEPAQSTPYLSEIARLEYERRLSLHSANARPIDPKTFSEIPVEMLLNQRISLHPSTRVVESSYPIYSIWIQNVSGIDTFEIPNVSETVLIRRLNHRIEQLLLPSGGARFFQVIKAGKTLEEGLDDAVKKNSQSQIAKLIQLALECAIKTDPSLPNEPFRDNLNESC